MQPRRKIDEVAKVGVCYVFGRGKVDAATCLSPADGRPNILIVGDSYAASVCAGMVERYGDRAQLSLLAAASCRPLVEPTTNQNGCPERNALVFDQLDLRVYDMVFLIGALDADQVHPLREAVVALRRRHARQIVVVGSPHSYSEHVTETFQRFGASEPKSAVMARVGARVESKYLEVDQAMKAANLGAAYVSMIDVCVPPEAPRIADMPCPPGTGRSSTTTAT